jgi:glycosyltransferase involved in cell wall biosynthesis
MNDMKESVSIIIPAYQEAENIARVVRQVKAACQNLDCDNEIIVVCDGSTDGTGDAAREAGANVVRHEYNKGYGAALKTGIRAAAGRTVIFIDADGQHDARDIARLLAERQTYDMVVGARKGTAGSPFWRKPGKLFLGWLANRLTGRNIPDLNSGYRAMDREMALRFLPLMPDGFSFSTTSTIAAFKGGYTVGYIPIEIARRAGNKSMVRVADGFNTLMLIIRIVTLFSPLRVFLPISILTFLIGLAFTIHGYATVGESSVRGLIALLASVQFFLFGILVDQVVAVRRGETIR